MTIRVYGKHEIFTIIGKHLYSENGEYITSGFLRIMAAMLIRGGVVAFDQFDCKGNLEYSWCERKARRGFAV